ncbi:MAG: ATP-dependent helicase [Candidatus Bathyarchaeota archaeon]|uniref:ATP-dependent helicase n=2 Tax=Candidatus Bathycorpusculum sp. TaxID=2994959 RepID=UPI002834A048|nr:ATP-dependent helicase [Candidatus Termiticorpusculum sp.]
MQTDSTSGQKTSTSIFGTLNSQQVEAVKEIERPLLIIAGAGSGKTMTVASKIVYLIEMGLNPESILALTFNQKAAEELKVRVTGMLNSSEDLNISTFHSFCKQIIQDNILYTKLNSNFKIITDTTQLVYLTKNINNFGIEHLEFNHEPYTLAEEMKKFISRCKDEAVTPEDLQEYIKKQDKLSTTAEEEAEKEEALDYLNNLRDMLKIYRAYESYKLENNMIDFGDMLYAVYNLLKSKPLILHKYQEKFKYIIVDEFQDTNYIQLQIVSLIAKKHGHLTVVGDDDQSIYKFRGAHLTNIAEFKKIFPDFVEKALEQNYRSTKKIVSVANALIRNSPERTIKNMFTNNPDGEKITVVETPNDTAQANYILEATKQLLNKYSPQDIAILCRRRATAEPIVKAFRKHGVPFNFVGETDFFQEPIIKDLTAFLKIIINPLENNAEIIRVLNRRNYDIKPIDICRFTHYADQNSLSLYETFDHLSKIAVDKFKFLTVKQTLTTIMQNKTRIGILELLHTVLFEQELCKYEIALKNTRNIHLINQFYEFVEEYNHIYPANSLEDFVDYLSFASNFKIEEEDPSKQAVIISTIHSVKGMQYPVVIVPDVNERKMPTTYQRDKFTIPPELFKGIQSVHEDKELYIQEERRLFYVALTRAEEKLVITFAKRYGENKTDSKPSKFLQEINYQQNHEDIDFQQIDTTSKEEVPLEVITTADSQVKTELLQQVIANLTTQRYTDAIENLFLFAKANNKNLDIQAEIINKIKEPDYSVLEVLNKKPLTVPVDHVFSVSQFTSYKKCPRLYQYRHVLKIPERSRYYFDFGSTIHNIAEQLTRMQKEGQTVDNVLADELLAKFWNPEGYKSKLDAERDYAEAKEILKVFIEEQNNNNAEILDIERWFETAIGEVRIRGRIDRIDRDKAGFTVIDYKTSKSVPSLNELKKDIQLLVYALAVRGMYGRDCQLKVGEWFLRSNKKIFFAPEEQAIEAIQVEIQEMTKKINAAEFEPKKDKWECSQCDYKCLCD